MAGEIKVTENRKLVRTTSIDVEPFEFKEHVRRGAFRTVRVTRAVVTSSWDFDKAAWRSSVQMFGRWALKDGSLGQNEYVASDPDWRNPDPRFIVLRSGLLHEHTPRTTITIIEQENN